MKLIMLMGIVSRKKGDILHDPERVAQRML